MIVHPARVLDIMSTYEPRYTGLLTSSTNPSNDRIAAANRRRGQDNVDPSRSEANGPAPESRKPLWIRRN